MGHTTLTTVLHISLLVILVAGNFCGLINALSQSSSSTSPAAAAGNRDLFFPNAVPATSENREVLQKQTGQVAPSLAAIGIPKCAKCQHGYPQVFLLDPIVEKRMNSGLLKLTCPLLVSGIDEMEDDGYIPKFTEWVQLEDERVASIQESHKTHARMRKQLILSGDEENKSNGTAAYQSLKERLGDKGADAFLNAGVAGASIDKPDVKCLHAWLGDYLFRNSSLLGEEILRTLEQERGISICGTADCHKFCDPSSTVMVDPPVARNKNRLKTKKERERRKRNKEKLSIGKQDKNNNSD